jgi:hypothetical protein
MLNVINVPKKTKKKRKKLTFPSVPVRSTSPAAQEPYLKIKMCIKKKFTKKKNQQLKKAKKINE